VLGGVRIDIHAAHRVLDPMRAGWSRGKPCPMMLMVVAGRSVVAAVVVSMIVRRPVGVGIVGHGGTP
jgi:hypothetical protein